jgi:hypothetical protein
VVCSHEPLLKLDVPLVKKMVAEHCFALFVSSASGSTLPERNVHLTEGIQIK